MSRQCRVMVKGECLVLFVSLNCPTASARLTSARSELESAQLADKQTILQLDPSGSQFECKLPTTPHKPDYGRLKTLHAPSSANCI